MGRLKLNIHIVIFVFFTISFYSQTYTQFDKIPEEELFATTNSTLFVAGESLYYNLQCFDKKTNKLSRVSKIAHVILVDDSKKIVFNQKVKLENGIGYGAYYLPSNIKTGNYKLIYYTNWMNNNKETPIYYTDIYVISAFYKNTSSLHDNKNSVDSITKKINYKFDNNRNNNISLSTDFNTYSTRSKVVLSIEDNTKDLGTYSLSVRKLDSVEVIKRKRINSIKPKNQPFFLPEIRGEIISGKLYNKETKEPAIGKILTLSIKGNNAIYKNFKTNELGNFYFNLYENYETNDLIIQVLDENSDKYQIVLDEQIPNFINELSFSKVALNPSIESWLLNKSISNQIENAFYQSKEDSIIKEKKPDMFFGKADKVYVLDDYTRFPTIKETFIEIVNRVIVRKRKGINKIVLFTNTTILDTQLKHINTLLLIDGIHIQNHDILLDYNPALIGKIELLFDKYFVGNSIYDGIISVKTKKGDFSLPNYVPHLKTEIRSPISKKEYYQPNYNSQNPELLKRIPDYRNQLIWKPFVKLDNTKIDFYTSDVKGIFEVRLVGFNTKNESVEIKKYFTVK